MTPGRGRYLFANIQSTGRMGIQRFTLYRYR